MVYEVRWKTDNGVCKKLTTKPEKLCKEIVESGGIILRAKPVKQTKANKNIAKRDEKI